MKASEILRLAATYLKASNHMEDVNTHEYMCNALNKIQNETGCWSSDAHHYLFLFSPSEEHPNCISFFPKHNRLFMVVEEFQILRFIMLSFAADIAESEGN